MDPLEFLRARNRHELTLPSGLNVTIRLPDVIDCMAAVAIPIPLLDEVERIERLQNANPSQDGRPEFIDADKLAEVRRLHREMVRRAIVCIEGHEVEMPAEAVDELEPDDFEEVRAYAMRTKIFPKAGAPT